MDVFEAIRSRRSIRNYLDKEVDWELLGRVIEAAKQAPSAGNQQNWKFIVVTDKAKRASVSEACLQQYWMQMAPVHIIVCTEPQKARQFYGIRGERLYSIQNCAAAIQNLSLAAHALGLGTCWIGAFDEEMLKRVVGIPDYVRPQAIITLGYPAGKVEEPWEYRVYDVTHLEKWDRRIRDVNWVMKNYSVTVNKEAARHANTIIHHGKRLVEHGRRLISGKKTG
ncbi:MAG: nitroreductase family protein [Nanoarchaeota archaeon]